MSDIEQKLAKSNELKYGKKEYDQISQNYRLFGKNYGDFWCSENIKRYLTRFTKPDSTKSNNLTDLLKARDYLERMIEMNTIDYLGSVIVEEIIEDFKKEENGKN